MRFMTPNQARFDNNQAKHDLRMKSQAENIRWFPLITSG